MFQFKLVAGSFMDTHNKKFYTAPAVVESPFRLDKSWPRKFQLAGETKDEPKLAPSQPLTNVEPPKLPAPQTEENEEKEIQPEEKPEKAKAKGKLVDNKFEFDPKKTGLHVYLDGNKYYVYDADDLKTPLNDKPLTKGKVLAFIESQCEE